MPVCDLCNVKLSSQSLLDSHNRGRKHQARLAEHNSLQSLKQRSVFLSKFTLPVDEEEIAAGLCEFGEVERVLLDRQNSAFAIVEFKDKEVASWLVSEVRRINIAGNDVNIQARRVDFDRYSSSSRETGAAISSLEVWELLRKHVGFDSQVDALVSKFSIGKSNLESRERFTSELGDFLQRQFGSPIVVHLFGSSLNGTGMVKSDMDLNLSGARPRDSHCDGGNDRATIIADSAAAAETHAKGLDGKSTMWEGFIKLPPAERAKIVGRLVNAYRKESGMLNNIVVVPDARCPVVRFELKHPLRVECELSIDNHLGECKANFIRRVIERDNSGVLKHFIFTLKLWASSNLVTMAAPSPDHHKTPKTHWSSYSMTLLAIHFFQSIGLGAIDTIRDSTEIDGWKVDYAIAAGTGDSAPDKESLACMFRNCEDRVVSVHAAQLYPKEEFATIIDSTHPPFKFSLVNVQDPLELSHNTTANVSRQYLTLLRKKLMYSIVALKRNGDDLSQLFDLDSVQQDMETATSSKAEGLGHSIMIGGMGMSFSQIIRALHSLLEDILNMEQMNDPMRKRLRCENPAMTNSSINDGEELASQICMVARYPVWLGRRQIRRNLARSHPNLHGLLLEREVTREIAREKTAEAEVYFHFNFSHHNDHLCKKNGSTALTCHFEEASSETSNHNAFLEMFHFLETFIPAHISEAVDKLGNREENAVADMECD